MTLVLIIGGIVISMYYYFGVVRAIYWAKEPEKVEPIALSRPIA